MLSRLQIENFILVDSLTLEFTSHLNVLTGETGAGKSILIDAIRFILGERLDAFRLAPDKKTAVEAVFTADRELAARDPLFSQFLDPEDDVLILRREVSDGKSRSWVNQRAVTQSVLKQLGKYLVDIHGQYDHQLLLDPSSHLELVDRFAKNEELLTDYQASHAEYRRLIERRREMQSLEAGREREADLLKYQISEIESVDLKDGEAEDLKLERIRLTNAEKLFESAAKCLLLLDGEEAAASNSLGEAVRHLNALVRLDESLKPLLSRFEEAQLMIEEGIRELRDYQENLSFDADRLEEVDRRQDQIELLVRKYGSSAAAIREFLEKARTRYDQLINHTLYEKELDTGIRKIETELRAKAEILTERRIKAGKSMEAAIKSELKDLELPHARFQIAVEDSGEWLSAGRDRVIFRIQLNPGHGMLELEKILSAGEVSRVMLALKKALMQVDPIPCLIFDEIDANIGGRLGSVTGKKLKEIAGARQVLLITHLPQIASFADRHIRVIKRTRQGKTATIYEIIEGEERVRELAQMMSGREESEISRKHASEMLNRSSPKR